MQAAVATLADARAEIKEAEARLTTVKAAVLERVEAVAADALAAARADLKEATARLTAVSEKSPKFVPRFVTKTY